MQVSVSRRGQQERALVARAAPFALEQEASQRRAARAALEPRGFAALLHWYAVAWRAEPPLAMHGAGVWVGRQEQREGLPVWPTELLGGSHLGAPRWSESFRRFLTDHPARLDQDGHYCTPLRAALWRLTGRGEDAERPFMARFLWRLGCSLDGAGAFDLEKCRGTIPPQVVRVYAEAGLARLWRLYREQPEARVA